MQVSDCERVGGKGLFSLKFVPKGDIVFVLTGPVKDTPCKYSIDIGENHITAGSISVGDVVIDDNTICHKNNTNLMTLN